VSAPPEINDPAAAFAVLRGLALYLLSALTASGALLAWPLASSATTAVIVALASAAALIAGEAGRGDAAEAQRTWRGRGRLLFAVAYAAMAAIALMIASAVPTPAVLAREAVVFAALQPALLLLAAAMGDVRLALTNALALVVVAALRGGAVAAVTSIGAFVLTATFLLAENAVRVLGAYAARRGPTVHVVLREGMAEMAPVTVALTALLWLSPPRPWPGLLWTSGPAGELQPRVYVLLSLAALLGTGAVGLAAQLMRRGRRRPAPMEDLIEVIAVDDEALPEPRTLRRAPIKGPRGAVVRAYLLFLRGAARLGRPRPAHATPVEYAASLGHVDALAQLTAIFMDARYGPDDPPAESAAAAEACAAHALADIAARPRAGRPPRPR
jgi:hypothetical protein